MGILTKLTDAFNGFMQLCMYIIKRVEKKKEDEKRNSLKHDASAEWVRQFGGTDKRNKKPPVTP